MKNSKITLVSALSVCSLLIMGFSMPGCGSDPAVKQTVEALQGRVMALEQQIKVIRDENAMSQKKLEDMAGALSAQTSAIQTLTSKLEAAQHAPKPAAATKTSGVTKKPQKHLPKKKKGH